MVSSSPRTSDMARSLPTTSVTEVDRFADGVVGQQPHHGERGHRLAQPDSPMSRRQSGSTSKLMPGRRRSASKATVAVADPQQAHVTSRSFGSSRSRSPSPSRLKPVRPASRPGQTARGAATQTLWASFSTVSAGVGGWVPSPVRQRRSARVRRTAPILGRPMAHVWQRVRAMVSRLEPRERPQNVVGRQHRKCAGARDPDELGHRRQADGTIAVTVLPPNTPASRMAARAERLGHVRRAHHDLTPPSALRRDDAGVVLHRNPHRDDLDDQAGLGARQPAEHVPAEPVGAGTLGHWRTQPREARVVERIERRPKTDTRAMTHQGNEAKPRRAGAGSSLGCP